MEQNLCGKLSLQFATLLDPVTEFPATPEEAEVYWREFMIKNPSCDKRLVSDLYSLSNEEKTSLLLILLQASAIGESAKAVACHFLGKDFDTTEVSNINITNKLKYDYVSYGLVNANGNLVRWFLWNVNKKYTYTALAGFNERIPAGTLCRLEGVRNDKVYVNADGFFDEDFCGDRKFLIYNESL